MTKRDFTQMNQLVEKFGAEIAVLAFPCNQFGNQENGNGKEILNSLKYIRPGNNFEPKAEMFQKVTVNGKDTHPVFQFLKTTLPFPADDCVSFVSNSNYITWEPVTRSDISWNFEKFLINKKGKPVMRFSSSFETINIANDIERLLEE